jgi:2-polyprenyl-3-methyl-5-hydroxy-6-metoxy-1,4-benzoquinol methylase
MTVYSDFERKYRFTRDPWEVTSNSSYYEELQRFVCSSRDRWNKALDCGCGEGHFTSQLTKVCDEVHGVDVSRTAIERARKRFPDVFWHNKDVRNIHDLKFPSRTFDLIVCSQVLYYLAWSEAAVFLANLESLLSSSGVLCVAAYCPGGNYLSEGELRALLEEFFQITAEQRFENHLFLSVVRRPIECVISVDYEAWDFYDETRVATTDVWEREVIRPCGQLMQVCEEFDAPLTIFLEIGEYWFLERYLPESAARIRDQLIDAVTRGHDVQVHLHTRWLPDFGARVDSSNNIVLSRDVARLHDLPFETLVDIFTQARNFLELLLRQVRKTYRANVFRGGKYQIQPHELIFRALERSGYQVDSSVWHGGSLSVYDRAPGFDFRSLWHPWRPYRPSQHDVCAPASDGDCGPDVVEMPILACGGVQWSFDGMSADEAFSLWSRLRVGGGPRIMIGHTKTVNSEVLQNLRQLLRRLSGEPDVVFTSLQKTAEAWHERCQTAPYQEARRAHTRRSSRSPADLFSSLAPPDRGKIDLIEKITVARARAGVPVRVLDIGCGTGEFVTLPLHHRVSGLPQVTIQGIDIDRASIARAKETASSFSLEGISFACSSIEEVTEEFDLVICSELLEYLPDPLMFLQLLSGKVAAQGWLVVTSPNRYGYAEIERRVLNNGFELVQGLPFQVKKWLIRGRRRISREWLKRKSVVPSSESTPSHRMMKTLNFQGNIPLQRYSLTDLRGLLRKGGFDVDQAYNLRCLGGIAGGFLEQKLGLHRYLHSLPAAVVADWMFVCRRCNAGRSNGVVRTR